MASSTRTLKFKQIVQAPPLEVYRAFTNATALREWLCDTAQAEPHKGGRLYLAWNDGSYTSGQYLTVDPGKKIAFTWRGPDEPDGTQVQVTLKPQDGSTLVSLTHDGFGGGKKWADTIKAFEQGWTEALENLASIFETGQDLRFVRRPMLGISGGEDLNPEIVAKLGVPVTNGVRIDGVVDGMGAKAAGLQANDVIVGIGGKKVTSGATMLDALQGHRAGDKVPVVFYRGGEKKQVTMELSQRPLREVPATAGELADALRQMYAEADSEVEQAIVGVSEAEASFAPAPNEWSAKEVLAHLIIGERDSQFFISALVQRAEPESGFGNLTIRNRALVCAFPTTSDLLTELKRSEAETVAFVELLPDEFVARKGSYWRMGLPMLQNAQHTHEHLTQIRAAIEAARKSG